MYWQRTGVPVIALHGWLDNAASFCNLANNLTNTDFLALDLAGHGYSDHRPEVASYAIWDDVAEVLAIADAMEWPRFCLIGHSRGAAIATLIAATAPERVAHVTWLDGGWPQLGEDNIIPQLKKSVEHRLRTKRAKRIFSSIDEAVAARQRGMFELSYNAANQLTARSLEKLDQGYSWRTDVRLMDASDIKLTEAQMSCVMEAVECPVNLYFAIDERQQMLHWREMLSNLKGVESKGYTSSHHLHMEDACVAIAHDINEQYIHLATLGEIDPAWVSVSDN